MPVYEYECPECKKVHEVQQKMTDEPLFTCPECGGEVKKLISASSFQLKGGGWYADGYSGTSGAKEKKKTPSTDSSSTPSCKGEAASCASCPASATAS